MFYGDDVCVSRDPILTGRRIAKRRHQLNRLGYMRAPGEPRMRQADLAARLGVAASTVANWERGAAYPQRYLGAVEQVLGITLTDEDEAGHPGAYPDPNDPEEVTIWSWEDLAAERRRGMIDDLRATRRAAARAARPTG